MTPKAELAAGQVLELMRAAFGVWGVTRQPTIGRILGVRNLLQGGLAFVAARKGWGDVAHRAGAGVDVLHLLSMVGLALFSPRRRRFATRSAAVASLLAGAELLTCRHDEERCAGDG